MLKDKYLHMGQNSEAAVSNIHLVTRSSFDSLPHLLAEYFEQISLLPVLGVVLLVRIAQVVRLGRTTIKHLPYGVDNDWVLLVQHQWASQQLGVAPRQTPGQRVSCAERRWSCSSAQQ